MRINQHLASALGWSRREADRAIEKRAIKVNGKTAKLGQEIDPEKDIIIAFGKRVALRKKKAPTIIALYKPKNYVSTRKDPQGRKTVMSLLPPEFSRLKPAGRLDYASEGLLLLSDEGTFINQYTHPRYQKEKEYIVTLQRPITSYLLSRFQKGVQLREGSASVNSIEKLGSNEIRVVMHQGWNRQIRRMAEACGNSATKILQTRIGEISLQSLKPGEWRII